MIQSKLLSRKILEFQIEEYIRERIKRAGFSHVKLQMTPLGEKIIIYSSRPGLVVGRKGQNIKLLTKSLKSKFKLENPQIELSEVDNPNLDAAIIAERVANSLERFGVMRFKGIGHKTMETVMQSGARGIEIILSGKIPSTRAKRWRFYQGYLKKSGDIALTAIKTAYNAAQLKSGTIGVQVRIMTPDVIMPDNIQIRKDVEAVVEHVEEKTDKTSDKSKRKSTKRKTRTSKKKEESEKKEENANQDNLEAVNKQTEQQSVQSTNQGDSELSGSQKQ